ncbi:uncharacterized protein Tco025E_06803 [Trypanosoma conorhini]|uniref:Uncharacterized protein n=1 Tax=Trypanosoma conorhini TaxID=83891 RepID=A0A422NY36_9TRYP|nr:uncharacterized protein Tco025E_06803 [Trypanosoma conorhini]RNF10314.1 hypothetical protein Tco025E_06803 [Trypanosoma conorhini]
MHVQHMLERCRMRLRRSMKRGTRLALLLTIVALLLLLSITMFNSALDEVGADEVGADEVGAGDGDELEDGAPPPHRDKARLQGQIERGRASMLLHAEELLALLQRFSDERGVRAANAMSEAAVHPANTSLATPEALLTHYYGTELIRLNNVHEKDLDDGYAQNVLHSDTYWSPSHVTRRGYGLEGSIFVGVTHSQEAAASAAAETACAATVRSLYEAARWPLAIFTGIVDVTLRTPPRDAAAASAEAAAQPPEETPAWAPPPASVCVPRAYLLPSCAERVSFCPTDNIRVRQVRAAQTTADAVGAAGNARRRRPHPLFSSVAAQRYATLTLYRGETYVMFIRAGVQLVSNWDLLARTLWLQLPSRQAVLSQPPVSVTHEAVQAAWDAVVVRQVEGILLAADKMLPNATAQGPPQSQPREGKLGNGVGQWLESIQWTLNLEAVRLQPAGEAAAGGKDAGLRVEEVVHHVFHHDAAVFRHAKEQAPMTGGASLAEEEVAPAAASRRRIQLYWLRQFYEALRGEFLKDVVERNTTACLSGVQMPEAKSRREAAALFRLHATRVRRLSHAMRDPRYMRPSPFHACGGTGATACPEMSAVKHMCHSDAILPYLLQAWVTTDFLFTRAEAFVDLPRDAGDGYGGPTHADTVQLDPFLSFVGADEEAVLLSARLWTHGWELFSATEPVAFVVTPPTTQATAASDARTLTPALLQLRERSVARLRHIIFGKNGTAGAAPDVEAAALREVERYGLGRRRSKEQLFYFSGLQEAARQRERVAESNAEAEHAVESICPAFFCRSRK